MDFLSPFHFLQSTIGLLLFLITINLVIVSEQESVLVHNQNKDGICYLMLVLAAAKPILHKARPLFYYI